MTQKKNKKIDYDTEYTKNKKWSDKDIIELIKEKNFNVLKDIRDNLVKHYDKVIGEDRENTKMLIKFVDDGINFIISTRIRARRPISEGMRNFVSYKFGEDSCAKPLINKLFPNINCKELHWSDIGLDYCSQDKIEIKIGKVKKKISIEEFGFKKAKNSWNLLFTISTKNGFIDYQTLFRVLRIDSKDAVQKSISRLRKKLSNYFGINEKPISYNYIQRCYQTEFLYIRNTYLKKAKEIQNSDEVYI